MAGKHFGKICAKHPEKLGERYDSGCCVQCNSERSKKYREKNRETLVAYRRGYYIANKERFIKAGKKRYADKKEDIKRATRAYSIANKEKNIAWQKTYRETNKEQCNARTRRCRKENPNNSMMYSRAYRRENPEKGRAAAARRRSLKLQATPAWANNFFIAEIYHLAKLRGEIYGGEWEVDHIVPLKSKLVCGLHVECNLRVITSATNNSKGNRYWPDMPV
jgi:hypothetical protein